QVSGAYAMNWRWARGTAGLSPVPSRVLTLRREPAWKLRLARALDWTSEGALIAALACALWAAWTNWTAVRRALGRHARLASLLFFVGLTVVETWPLATHPGRMSRNDNGDTVQNEWILAWVAHAAPRTPLHLFDTNVLYPERGTLAYSESM